MRNVNSRGRQAYLRTLLYTERALLPARPTAPLACARHLRQSSRAVGERPNLRRAKPRHATPRHATQARTAQHTARQQIDAAAATREKVGNELRGDIFAAVGMMV